MKKFVLQPTSTLVFLTSQNTIIKNKILNFFNGTTYNIQGVENLFKPYLLMPFLASLITTGWSSMNNSYIFGISTLRRFRIYIGLLGPMRRLILTCPDQTTWKSQYSNEILSMKELVLQPKCIIFLESAHHEDSENI